MADHALLQRFFDAIERSDLAEMDLCFSDGATAEGMLYGVLPLMHAAKHDRSGPIEKLLQKGAAVNATDALGFSALHIAVANDSLTAMTALIKAGANPDLADPDGDTPRMLAAVGGSTSRLMKFFNEAIELHAVAALCKCVTKGDIDGMRGIIAKGIIKDFDQKPAFNDMAPLMEAIRVNNPEALELLLQSGAKAGTVYSGRETPLGYVIAHYAENPRLAALLLAHGASPDQEADGEYPLLAAAAKGQEAIVKLLIAANADPRKTDGSRQNALHRAAEGGHAEIIPLLKNAGVNVDAQDQLGRTPLFAAIMSKRRSAFDALLAAGAEPNIPSDDGMTTLQAVVWTGDADMIPVLLQRGADLNAQRPQDGYSALHFAAFRGKTAAARLLLAAGADCHTANGSGHTPVQVARERGCDDIAAMIIEKEGQEALTGLREAKTVRKPLRLVYPGGRNG